MKETKLEIPAGFEVDKTEVVNGALVVTFKEIELKLPKSWDEFCEIFPIKGDETFITSGSYVDKAVGCKRDNISDKNLIPDHATANAVLALCQLIQLRNVYNGDWVPDWDNPKENKWTIIFYHNNTDIDNGNHLSHILYFKNDELRDEFLSNFRPLIEKLKPLYGIKEGGEE